jgi:rhomboid-like protein
VKSGAPPPRGGERGWRAFNRLPQSAVVYGIAGLNAVVFMGWYYAKAEYEMRRDVGPWQRMQANFVASWHNVVDNNR